jgi:signal transduction histidine kinase
MSASRGCLTVQAWILLVLACLGVFMTVSAAVGYHQLHRTAQVSDHLLTEVSPAAVQAYRLQTALLDQETGVRGYLITGDRQFLEPYNRGVATQKDATARLERLIGDVPRLAADLDAVRRAAADWRGRYATPVVERVGASGPGRTDETTAERGKRLFDRIRGLSTTQVRHLDQERADGTADLAHVRSMRDRTFAGMVVAFFLTGVVLAVLVNLMVVRPLTRLRQAVHEVAGGAFQRRIPSHGPADLRAVADAVEAMRLRIVTELDDSLRKEAALNEQARISELQSAELRRSNAELEQFAYVASHDLQEPLRKVASFCQLLEKRYGTRLDERGAQYIGFAVDGAKRMQVLINDLLTFSRVGRVNDARVTLSLDRPLDRALSHLSTAVEESGAKIVRPPSLPELTGEPTLLTMLWQNLIGNAIKFRAPGRTPEIRVEAEGPDEDGMWRFSVTDNGIGVAPEFADKIFVIFQRLHSRDTYGGTGIGLALCKKIVEHHGGRIWLDPVQERGTRIHFTIPATVPAPTSPAVLEGSTE